MTTKLGSPDPTTTSETEASSLSGVGAVAHIRRTVFGVFGLLRGREIEFCYATRMWSYTDGSGYAYGARS